MTDVPAVDADQVIPVISIAGARAGDLAARRSAARLIDEASRGIGFFCIDGHGVDPDLVTRLVEVSESFFTSPIEVKRRYASMTGNPVRGWSSRAVEGPDGPVEVREHIEMSRFDSPDDLAAAGYSQEWIDRAEANVWPSTPAELKTVWKTYFSAMDELGMVILGLMAEALGLPAGWFDDKFDRQSSYLACNRYPATRGRLDADNVRFAQHTDIGSLTMLYQDDGPGGLQLLDRSGHWVDVPFRPNTYIVNLGDLLAKWTNDRWVATPHRVLVPDPNETRPRFSVPYFQHPNFDALIECIPTCLGPDSQPRYPAVLAGNWADYRFFNYEA